MLKPFSGHSAISHPRRGRQTSRRRPISQLALLLFLAATAGCGTQKSTSVPKGESTATAILNDVTVLADPAITAASLSAALDQVSRPTAPVVGVLPKAANSVYEALPEIQKLVRQPIVAMTEYQDWLWFATDVAREPGTKAVNTFLKGYALQKAGTKVLKWSVQ